MKKINLILVSLAILAGAAGCSGGGSSGGGTPVASKVTINASNQSAVTNAALSAATQNMGKGFASVAGGVQTSTNSNTDRILFNAADVALQRMALHQSTPISVIGAVTTTPCTISGNFTVDTDSATYYKETDNNCVDATGGPTYNGHFYITGISNTTTAFSAAMDFNLTVVTNGTTTLSLVGGFSLSESGRTSAARVDTMQGPGFVVTAGTVSFSLTNFNFVSTYNDNSTSPIIYHDNVNYTVGLIDTANPATNFLFSFATTQNNLMVNNSTLTYPVSGQFVVTGDASTALRVTFLPTSGGNTAGTSTGLIQLELSSDGGATYPTSTTKTWATL
jgi:hypothetical protein